jgi:uncharacterized protein (DUF885 family)
MPPVFSVRRRTQMAAALICGSLVACMKNDASPSGADPAIVATVNGLADEYVNAYFKANPESATIEGRADADHGALRPNSVEDIAVWRAKEDAWLRRLRAVDPATLDGTSAKLAYAFLDHLLTSAVATRPCNYELWNVSQTFTGWQSTLSFLFTVQPVGNDGARASAVERVLQLPRFLSQEIDRLREGMRQGHTAPAGNVRLVIGQMDELLAMKVEASPMFDPARRDSTPGFGDRLRSAIADSAMAGIRGYRDFLRTTYLPAARPTIALSANPGGAECYRASVQAWSSLAYSAEEVHQMGLREMEKIDAEAKAIGQRLMGTDDVARIYELARTDPKFTFRSRDQLMTVTQDAIARARAKVPQYFGIVPKADVAVQPVPAYEEKTAPGGQYFSASDDGKRPGTYLINLHEPEKQSRAMLESTAFHETYPGHHLQVAIAKERGDAPAITRYFGNSGYIEGWALYAERLADEMGLLSGDIDKLGLASSEALRAARLVVDAGMHALGWSRQQAIDYLLAHTAESVAGATSEIDRYIAVPGQATSYMIGRLEIMRLRDSARARLGNAFDIREFHDQVLQNGSVTLALLRSNVDAWIATKSGR